MKFIKYLAIIGFLSILTISCEKDPKPNDDIQKIVERKLPVLGVYEFSHGGPVGTIKVVFKETSYRGFMQNKPSEVSKVYFNSKENIYKAIIKAPNPQADGKQFRTLFFRNIKDNSVEVHQDYTFKTEKEAIDSKYPNANDKTSPGGPGGHSSFGWIPLTKSQDQTEPPIEPEYTGGTIENLNGTYVSNFIPNQTDPSKNVGQYHFKIGTNEDAFLFMGDFGGTGNFNIGASITLSKEYEDVGKGLLIYKITEATGYYGAKDEYPGHKGEYITLYAKNITTDGSEADFAIATKNKTHSFSYSKLNVLGKTLEEAKSISPPEDDQLWENSMMEYAHLWMSTTRL